MKRLVRFGILSVIFAASVAAKKDDAPIDPGPRPDVALFRQQAEQAVLAGFFDPSSAQFQWNYGLVGGYFKPVLQRKYPGWWTCGLVNGKNRMGGYVGFRSFVAVMNNGQITLSLVGDGGTYDFIAGQCQQAISKGILPPAEAPEAPTVAAAPTLGLAANLGFTYRNDGDTVVVSEVSPGGIGASAGLTQFMVVERVNGLSLQGLTPEMRAKLFDNASTGATLTVRGRGEMRMVPPAAEVKPAAPSTPKPHRAIRR